MARDGPVLDLRRALGDHHHVLDLGPALAVAAGAARLAPPPSTAQMAAELAPKRPPRLHVERAVDRLVGDLHALIVGVRAPQPARDLLRGVVLAQALDHHPAQLGATLELGLLRAPRPPPGLLVGEVGAVAPPTAAAADLAADRRVRAAERAADRPIRVAAGDTTRDLLALGERQTARRAPTRAARPNPPTGIQVTVDPSALKAEPPGDLSLAHTLGPHPPDPILLSLSQALASHPHRHTSLVRQPQPADSLGWCGGNLRPPPISGRIRTSPVPRELGDAPIPFQGRRSVAAQAGGSCRAGGQGGRDPHGRSSRRRHVSQRMRRPRRVGRTASPAA